MRNDPAGRAAGTARYGITITYGDTETAERAGEVLRTIQSQKRAVDPITGETYPPNDPDLLLGVHGTLVWAVLTACEHWEPPFTAAERDRFVDEQRASACLVGIDPEAAPCTVAELDAYSGVRTSCRSDGGGISAQADAGARDPRDSSQLGMTPRSPGALSLYGRDAAAAWLRHRHPLHARDDGAAETALPPSGLVQLVMTCAAVDLLPPVIQDLNGFRCSGLNHLLVRLGSALIMKGAERNVSYDKLVAELRAQTKEHAFGRAARKLRTRRETGVSP